MLLMLAILFFGALLGLSFAVLTRAVTGETLLGLWGPALGAGIAATATLSAAIYSQHRAERRELRPFVRAVERDLNHLHGTARQLHAVLRQERRRHARRDPHNDNRLTRHLHEFLHEADQIKPDDKLPRVVTLKIRNEIGRACEHVLASDRLATEAMKEFNSDELWVRAEEETNYAANRITDLYVWLTRWTE